MPRIALILVTLIIATTASSQTSSSKNKPSAQHVPRPPTTSASAETVYRNPDFGFTYRIPYAWADRTKDMQDESADPAKSRLLLAVFERPPQVTGETVNSAVVITAESADSYPGLKSAADYMGPLTELTTSKGFKSDGGPYEFPVGTTATVRADFARPAGSITMHQSSLVILRKGFVVSFTFIAGSDDELDELVEKLSFSSAKP
jgi:hypothetical protein